MNLINMPASYILRDFVVAGGLMSYGTSDRMPIAAVAPMSAGVGVGLPGLLLALRISGVARAATQDAWSPNNRIKKPS